MSIQQNFRRHANWSFAMKNLKKQNKNVKKNRPADRLQLLRHIGKLRLLQIDSGRKSYKQWRFAFWYIHHGSCLSNGYYFSNCCFVIYDMVINFFATLRLIIFSSVLVIFCTVRLDSISNRTVQNKEGSVNSIIYKSILSIQTSCFSTLLSAISFNFRDTPSFVILSSRWFRILLQW